jgi:aromatic ring-opening dioxygenase LigB subunit
LLAFAAIAPHGDIAIEEACSPEDHELARETRAAMSELSRRFEASGAEATVLLTPHNVHVEGSFAVVLAGSLKGRLGDFLPGGAADLELTCPVDSDLSESVLAGIRKADLPAVGVSFGGNNRHEAIMPMDWGTLVPLWHMGGRANPPVAAVVVSPARDRPVDEHVRVGTAIAEVIEATGKRVALVASADHGHAHSEEGPYGFDPAAADFDSRIVELVRENRLTGLLEIDLELVASAAADSFWQLLMLHGALGEAWRAELLSYEAPVYYGMLCAAFERRRPSHLEPPAAIT